MNKKGFTLIELLATIIILSIIMIIAVPNVMSVIDKNKQATYVADAKKMITLTEYKLRKNTSINYPSATGKSIAIKLSALDLTDFNDAPEGGEYDSTNSYVLIVRKDDDTTNQITYDYYVTIIEKYGQNSDKTKGIYLASKEELENEEAKKLVATNITLENIAKGSLTTEKLSTDIENVIDS